MTESEIRHLLREELRRRAPEIDFETIDPKADIREAFDIDSMDFLNIIIALHEHTGVDIPEADYPRLDSVDGAVAYLASKSR